MIIEIDLLQNCLMKKSFDLKHFREPINLKDPKQLILVLAVVTYLAIPLVVLILIQIKYLRALGRL